MISSRSILTCLFATLVCSAVAWGAAQSISEIPHELEGVDIVERVNTQLPLDTEFVDESGNTIVLGDLFTGERPVLLQMGYFKCPQLCNLVLNEMTDTLRKINWTTGKEFDVVAISINPEETAELAAAKRTSYVLMYDRRQSGKGWHFLTGPAESSEAVAEAVGFRYRLQPDGEYAHAAGLFVVTPDGRLSRYLYGATHDPGTMRLALLEAGEGRIGSTLDRFILWCHVYDPDSKSYVLVAIRLMQIGGAITLVILAVGLGWMWASDRRKSNASSGSGPGPDSGNDKQDLGLISGAER